MASTREPITVVVAAAKDPSPGFGVSSVDRCNRSITAAGYADSPPNRCTIAQASRYVLASATVGPDAITLGSSPITSEIASARQTPRLRAARRPPLIADKCLRTVFRA